VEAAVRQPKSRKALIGLPPCASASTTFADTNVPPFLPRRVSTKPASRRIAIACRSVIGATASMVASSSSLGNCSPGASTPLPIASPMRRTISSLALGARSGANVRARGELSGAGFDMINATG
jgi:hypothetical protein